MAFLVHYYYVWVVGLIICVVITMRTIAKAERLLNVDNIKLADIASVLLLVPQAVVCLLLSILFVLLLLFLGFTEFVQFVSRMLPY